MERVAVPYPRPNIDDLDELLLKEIINGTMYKAMAQSISQGKQPFERWINLDDHIVDRLSKGKITLYDFAYENEVIDYPKLKEWSWLPYYIEKNFGADIVFNPRSQYSDFDYQGKRSLHLDGGYYWYGLNHIEGDNSGMLLFRKSKTIQEDYKIFLYRFSTGMMEDTGHTSKSVLNRIANGFSFGSHYSDSDKLYIYTVSGGLHTIAVGYHTQHYGYPYSDLIFIDADKNKIFDKTGALKLELEGIIAYPSFVWKERLFFATTAGGTTIVNTSSWEHKTLQSSEWCNFGKLGLYDFYQGGVSKTTRFKYSLKKHGTLLPNTKLEGYYRADDQYADFQVSADQKVHHSYDTNSYLFTGISFTLPYSSCKALRYIKTSGRGGYYGRACISSINGQLYVEDELFRLYE